MKLINKNKGLNQPFTLWLVFLAVFCFLSCFPLRSEEKEKKPPTSTDDLPRIIEEVEVTAIPPAQQPISTASLVSTADLEKIIPKNLSEIMNHTAGTYVTEGSKGESGLMIRGLASNRITLMYDSIPIYEPYFNSFDLKSLPSSGIETIQVIKGSSSVLYGPNTLGGIVNVITKRIGSPFFHLDANLGKNSTYFVSGSGGYKWNRFAFFGNASWDKSDGYKWKNDSDDRIPRKHSDYDRKNFAAKLFYYPTEKSEIMAEVIYYTANYGIPAATDTTKTRFWDFKDWDRIQFNAGAVFPLFNQGSVKFRTYFIRHFNVLDAYTKEDFQTRQWESTYKNNSYGASLMNEIPIFSQHTLKLGVHYSHHQVRQQGDIGEIWEEYKRDIFSVGLEDHFVLFPQWKIIAGASIDYLGKPDGEDKTTLNPLVGLRFSPREWLSFHLSMAYKSRFPSMNSLYGSQGNPLLKDEKGRTFELGFDLIRSLDLSGTVFYSLYHDMIQAYRGLDGYKNYQNIGKAEIYGLELSAHKKIGRFDFSLNYTFLNTRDTDLDQPLDYTPKSQFNSIIDIGPIRGFSLTFWGTAASQSQVKLGKNPPFQVATIPGYVIISGKIDKAFGNFTLYLKVENLLDKAYFTEPGFPMRGRTASGGFQWGQDFPRK